MAGPGISRSVLGVGIRGCRPFELPLTYIVHGAAMVLTRGPYWGILKLIIRLCWFGGVHIGQAVIH